MCSPTRRSGIVFTSSSSPPRSLGISRLHAPSVGKRPGTMAQVRIPLGPHSTARLLVMASTPALAIADGTVKGAPISADTVRIDITTLLRSPASIQRRPAATVRRSEEHTSELQSRLHLVCRLLLEKKKKKQYNHETNKSTTMTQKRST